MKRLTLLLLFLIFAVATYAQAEQYSKVKIFTGEQGLAELSSLGIPIEGEIKKGLFFITDISASQIDKLTENGFDYEIMIENVSRYYAEQTLSQELRDKFENMMVTSEWEVPEGFSYGSMGGYLTHDEVIDKLDDMAETYPEFVKAKEQIGDQTSIEGRPLYWMKISDNPNIDEEEPEILYTSLHHAREPNSMMQMIFFMYYILENYEDDASIQHIINERELYFVPIVNPDGYIYNENTNPNGGGMWRKNRRNNGGSYGVDLNRNYSYQWGYDNNGSSPSPWDATYRGTAPFSEPETQIVRDFVYQHDFELALNYHTYTGLVLYPWGYEDIYTEDNDLFSAYANLFAEENGYATGTAWELLYNTNGDANDWFYGEQTLKDKIFAFTPEVGTYGFWPPQSLIIPECQENMIMNIRAALYIGAYAEVADQTPVILGDLTGTLDFSITRMGLGDASDFTVSIEPLGNEFISIGDPVSFTGLEILEESSGSIAYELDPDAVGSGASLSYLLTVDNGEIALSDTITKVYGSPVVLFEDACDNMNNWSGSWNTTTNEYHSAPASITDSPYGDYPNNANTSVTTTAEFDLGEVAFAALSFWAKWDIEAGWDYAQVKISTNGGSSWEALEGNYTHIGNGNQVPEPLYDGQSGWVLEEIDLMDYVGESVKFRFTLISDGYITEDGFYFDDINISVVEENPMVEANFEANITEVDEGGQVEFSDLSDGSPNAWEWSFEGGTPAASTEQNPVVTYENPGTFDVTLTVSNDNSTDTKTVEDYITVIPEPYWNFEGGNPADPVYTMYLAGATLESIDLETGDELAIFDGETMVGHYILENVLTPDDQFENDLIAFSTVVSGNGYDPGNPIVMKCWDASEDLVAESFTLNFSNPYGDAWTEPYFPDGDGAYSIVELEFATTASQTMNMQNGYQFVSTYMVPADPDLMVLLDNMMNDETLDFVRNSGGSMLQKIGPDWVNNIGDWITEEGYLFKMNEDDMLEIQGSVMNPQTPILLASGYQFISYLPQQPMDALTALSDVLENLDFVRNSNGSMLQKIGPNWVNNIGDMVPGEGYLVKMNAAGELIYPESTQLSGLTRTTPQYFEFEGGNAADPVYTIYIKPGEYINIGDEVAAYSNGKLVGATRITSENKYQNDLAVFSTLNDSKGFEAGEQIELRIWKQQSGQEIKASYELINSYGDAYMNTLYPNGDGYYSVAEVNTQAAGIEEPVISERLNSYPNPFSSHVFVEFRLNRAANVKLSIFNVYGQKLKTVTNARLSAGNHKVKLDGTDFAEGVLLYRFDVDNEEQHITRKGRLMKTK